jgi:hypothetical protein
MLTAPILLQEAAKCRRFAAEAEDDDAAEVLILLAEEYERLATNPSEIDAIELRAATRRR